MKTNLKQIRKEAGWSNADDFAAHVGIPAKTYRNYEQGIRKMGLDVACTICNALDCSIEDLGSLNGTWVDGAIVNNAALHDGSTIQIGTFRMVFHTNTL